MTYKGVLVENLSETQNDQAAPVADAVQTAESAPVRKRAPRRANERSAVTARRRTTRR